MNFTPLTLEQKRQFEEDGFLIVRGALQADEIERLIAAGDRLCATDATQNRYQTGDGAYDGFRNCLGMDDAFLALLTHPATMPLIVQLMGPRIHLITSHLIYKLPVPAARAGQREPLWHSDVAYTPDDLGEANVPRLEMKCAFYLTDMSVPDSGVTLFAPGSNRGKGRPRNWSANGDPVGTVQPLLRAGDAVFFENRTWHAGAVNIQPHTARMVMLGYGYMWLKPFDYTQQPAQVLAKVDDIGRQLLGGLVHPEGRFVPGGLWHPLRQWCELHDVKYVPLPADG